MHCTCTTVLIGNLLQTPRESITWCRRPVRRLIARKGSGAPRAHAHLVTTYVFFPQHKWACCGGIGHQVFRFVKRLCGVSRLWPRPQSVGRDRLPFTDFGDLKESNEHQRDWACKKIRVGASAFPVIPSLSRSPLDPPGYLVGQRRRSRSGALGRPDPTGQKIDPIAG